MKKLLLGVFSIALIGSATTVIAAPKFNPPVDKTYKWSYGKTVDKACKERKGVKKIETGHEEYKDPQTGGHVVKFYAGGYCKDNYFIQPIIRNISQIGLEICKTPGVRVRSNFFQHTMKRTVIFGIDCLKGEVI